MFESLLVAVDGSDESRAAAESAIELAEKFDGVVHGIYVRELHPTYTKKGASILAEDAAQDEEIEYALGVLDEIGTIADNVGVEFQSEVKSGVPAFVLTDAAQQQDVDAIVAGIRGRTGLRDRIVGSTTERILRESPVSVIAIR